MLQARAKGPTMSRTGCRRRDPPSGTRFCCRSAALRSHSKEDEPARDAASSLLSKVNDHRRQGCWRGAALGGHCLPARLHSLPFPPALPPRLPSPCWHSPLFSIRKQQEEKPRSTAAAPVNGCEARSPANNGPTSLRIHSNRGGICKASGRLPPPICNCLCFAAFAYRGPRMPKAREVSGSRSFCPALKRQA